MTMLDPKGLEAACAATVLGEDEYEKPVHLEPREAETAIHAYLSTVTPAEVGGLVERLRALDAAILSTAPGEAATALEAQAAELAAKEEARAEQWRLRREAEGSRDAARAACDTMRIERDEARAALAEARRALEEAERQIPKERWYWPEDDTSSDACRDNPREALEYQKPGEIDGYSVGGVAYTNYFVWLPPADDADSDDEFEVDEPTREAAKAKMDAEIARRALTGVREDG